MKAQSEHLEEKLGKAKEIIEPVGKAFIAHSIISAVIGFVIFAAVIITIIVIAVKQMNTVDEFDINQFNSTYEFYTGTE